MTLTDTQFVKYKFAFRQTRVTVVDLSIDKACTYIWNSDMRMCDLMDMWEHLVAESLKKLNNEEN